jgi:nucleotide-binding universal stress UspA family protein
MKPIRHILFASDFSVASRRAFDAALTLARSNDARLTILHVHVPVIPLVPEQYIESPKWLKLDRAARRWTHHQLAALAIKARKAGVRAKPRLVSGEPSRMIVRAARSARPDLVVVGTHGRTGFSRLLLGSTAERVVATAPCPVLTVRSSRKS